MRITTWNVNGLRAALSKNFQRHVRRIGPDVLLLQEVRALPEQLPFRKPRGFHAHWNPAEKKGYSGVAVWTRGRSERIATGLGTDDPEGRVLMVDVHGVRVISAYGPSGSSGPEAQARKDLWMEAFRPWAAALLAEDRPVIVGGDLNVAPTERDIHDPRGNKNNSGFLPHERQWFADLLDDGWVDLVRAQVGEAQGPYSWWSNRGKARELDRGWRIDHLLGNRAAAERVVGAEILRQGGLDTSDHAPVSIVLAQDGEGTGEVATPSP
ncbi:MAG: exodeoxyribonuclease III [Myxococcales bacterium]|nr:exodeoxyribonuclease III [Myxococcales bacterium]